MSDYEQPQFGTGISVSMGVAAVTLKKQADRVYAKYVECYEERYGTKPLFDEVTDQDVFLWLVKKVGEERAMLMVRFYLLMDGDNGWFLKNAHSLSVLRKNANVVSVQTALKTRNSFSNKHFGVWFIGHCDSCNEEKKITCPKEKLVGFSHHCDDCKKRGAQSQKEKDEFITRIEWIKRAETGTNKHKVTKKQLEVFKRLFA